MTREQSIKYAAEIKAKKKPRDFWIEMGEHHPGFAFDRSELNRQPDHRRKKLIHVREVVE